MGSCKRLEAELKERGEVQELLDTFIWQQKTLLKKAKKNLQEFQVKMDQVTSPLPMQDCIESLTVGVTPSLCNTIRP